jgi:hydrogenase nickel incorporation protein HypB
VLLLSTTEGDDKPGKYPKAFRTSDVVVITKADLLPYVPFSVKQAEKDARRVQPALKFFSLSAQTGDGVAEWCTFLKRERKRLQAAGQAEAEASRISHLISPLAADKRKPQPAKSPKSKIVKIGKE